MDSLLSITDIPRKPDGFLQDCYLLGGIIVSVGSVQLRKARIRSSAEKVLIRIVPRVCIRSNEDQEKLLMEISAMKQLSHPCLGNLYDYFQDIRAFYVVMQRSKGKDLSSMLLRSRKFPESLCLKYMLQIFSFLEYLHANNIACRAVTLENFLLSSDSSQAILKFTSLYYAKVVTGETPITERIGSPYYMAPEVIRSAYGVKADMWSAGVLMYVTLSGTIPFEGKTELEVFNRIATGEVRFASSAWNDISNPAKDLIRKLIEVDPRIRISATEALNHSWCASSLHLVPESNASKSYVLNLSTFKSSGLLKKLLLRYISDFFLSQNESEELLALFRFFDSNNDGMLTKEEIKEGLLKMFGNRMNKVDEIIQRIFDEVDLDESGKLSYNEFLVATINRQSLVSKERLEAVFKTMDVNLSRTIELSELKEALSRFGIRDDAAWTEMIKQCDINHDGKIDIDELYNLCLN